MKRLLPLLLLIALLPAIASSFELESVDGVGVSMAVDAKDHALIGRVVVIIGPTAGGVIACGEKYTTAYKAYLTDDLGDTQEEIRVCGKGLFGAYQIEKGEMDSSGIACVGCTSIPSIKER